MPKLLIVRVLSSSNDRRFESLEIFPKDIKAIVLKKKAT